MPAPYSVNFQTPDPFSWLSSSGEFSANDVFGPPANVLEYSSAGYPSTTAQNAAIRGQGAGSQGHWWQDRGVHGLAWIAAGWFLFHQYLKAD